MMNKKFVTPLFIVLISALLFSACTVHVGDVQIKGNGNVVKEDRAVSDFDKVSLSGIGELIIEQGDTESLTVEGEENLLSYITTEVKGSTLEIGIKSGTMNFNPTEPLRFYLTVKNLKDISVSGAGNVKSTGFTADELSVSLSGAGNVNLDDLQVTDFDVQISGAGNLDLSGKVTHQRASMSALGNYMAKDLESASTEIEISGAGNAEVWATESLDVSISGAGSVRYKGEPKITQSISGVGSVRSMD